MTSVAAASTAAAPAGATAAGPEQAGSVALAQGSVTDQATDGSSRHLKDGDVVYPGDSFTLGDDSYLDLDLEDGGRILLRPDTSFQIQEYHFDPDAHPAAGEQPLLATSQQQPENAFFKLVKGGLRAVDGLIGQSHPQNYGINTPVATIGVRGTAFDVRYCGDDCKDEADATGAPQNGLYTAVSDGSIAVKNDGGETVTKAGEYSYVQTRKAVAQRMDHAPRALRHMSLPPALKARADKNRQVIQQKRQARRQQVLEQRRQQAAGKPKPEQAKAPPAGKQSGTPAERRQQRMEQRQERKENARQQREQQNRRPEAGGGQRPERTEQPQRRDRQQETAPESRRERRQQRLQQMQEKREERQAGKAGGEQRLKRDQQDKGVCKDKKKKRKRKNKDGCGDG
ncbi:MAG TPA: FecR domain-containing protein [Gammaproteobacteria bacterium]|nr:FecR domain-containing protein [Gammaproteobacteria bacterium]